MILDTSFLIDVLRGGEATRAGEATLDEEGVDVVTAVSVLELWEGIHLADFDRPAATWAGETNAALAREGQRADVEDVMIGAIARQRDEAVLTRNVDDFERLPGVAVERY